MTEKIMQCCYTNAVKESGGTISSGWQAVVVSDGLPPEAYSACVNLQNANSMIPSHMVDEQGNVLDLFEIAGDGGYVYVIRTQYGLTDRLGRPNMFSHAYIFSWKQEDIIRDPNIFVTLTSGNFAKDEESARAPRNALERSEPFTLERALERAGMSDETYLTLIRCVYAQYSEKKTAKPVYVQYDGTQEQMQAILCCIYYGLPYCVRRNLSIASAATASTVKNRNLIFSVAAAKHESFVIPQTGENNILTPRAQRKIARYGFVDHAVQHYKEMDADDYFRQLEQLAMELGDPTASEELTLKIAHQLLMGSELSELTEEELNTQLSDALRSRLHGSQRMDAYISSMLDVACRRRLSLTEESEANLAQWLSMPVTDQLADAGERYNIYRLSTLSTDAAAKMLHGLSAPVFQRYRQTLLKNDKGLTILDQYYASYGLGDGEPTWEALHALLDEIADIPDAVKTRESIDSAAWRLYRDQLKQPGMLRRANRSLMDLMRRLHGEDQLRRCGAAAREIYWEGKTLRSFSRDKIDEYQDMRINVAQCKLYLGFSVVLDELETQGARSFLLALNRFVVEFRPALDPKDSVLDKLTEELPADSLQEASLSGWMEIAALPEAEEFMHDILELRSQLYRGEYDEVIDTYQSITGGYSASGYELTKLLSKTVAEECRKADSPDHWIPIDVWLMLGRKLYSENAFQIFDEWEPRVMSLEEPGAAEQSKLLGEYPFTQQAEAYIQDKGKAAKTVHRWISERKAADKRKKADERKTRREANGSTLGSFFSQLPFGGKGKGARRASDPDGRQDEDADSEEPGLPEQGAGEPEKAKPEDRRQNDKKAAEKPPEKKKGFFSRR